MPANKNFLSPLGFEFQIAKLQHVSFFVTDVVIPGITLSSAEIPTPFKRIPLTGDKPDFGDLQITFKIDEDMENYTEMFTWLTEIGFPDSYAQYNRTATKKDQYSDGSVVILTSSLNPNIEFKFQGLVPISLSEITLTTTATDIEYLTATATFKFIQYTITKIAK